MQRNKLLRAIVILFIIGINVGCDQVSKSVVRHEFLPYTNLTFLKGHFMITHVENTGAFLSLGDQMHGPLRALLLTLFPALLLIMSIYYLINARIHKITLTGICFITGGGIGNIYDRIVHGSVTDFLYIDYPPLHTGVFNMADVSITAGAIIILIGMNVKNPPLFLRRSRTEHEAEIDR